MTAFIYEKAIMNTLNRRQRRCVIGKVIPKKFVWYQADPRVLRPLPRESMFEAEQEWVKDEMARNREKTREAAASFEDIGESPPIWFFIVALVLFLATIAAVWSAS